MDERRNGTRRLYRARPEGLAELRAFLEEFWDARLEALKREAEREERKKDGARLSSSSSSASSRSRRPRRRCGSSSSTRRSWRAGRGGWRWRSTRRRAARFRIEIIPGSVAAVSSSRSSGRGASSTRGAGSRAATARTSCRRARPPSRSSSCPRTAGRSSCSRTATCRRASRPSRHARGWDHYLGRLAVVAAGGDPGPDPWLGGVPYRA